jgi:hypothetical protein
MSKRPTTIEQLEEIAANKLASARSELDGARLALITIAPDPIDVCLRLRSVEAFLTERMGILDAIALLKQAERRDTEPAK